MNDLATRKPPMFTLLVLMALASVGAVLFTPALPSIRHQFAVSTVAVQWTVNIFIIGYALGQIIYGPFANRFGRKPTLYVAIIIAIMGSLLSGFSSHLNSFSTLMVARFIMAIGSAAGLAMSFTIINDVYTTEESRRVIAYVSLAFAIMPGIAVFTGGFIVKHFSWEMCFYFLAAYYVFAFILCVFLPETLKERNLEALHFRFIWQRYSGALKDLNLWVYTGLWGVCTTIIYIFVATAPIISIVKMGLPPNIFGTFNLMTSGGLLLGGLIAAQINKRLPHYVVIFGGALVMIAGAVGLFIVSEWTVLKPWPFFSMNFIIYFGMPFVFSNATALATRTITDKASASSMMSFINMMFAVVGLYMMGIFHSNPEHIMPEAFLIIAALTLVLFFVTRVVKRLR